ncbi:hypothetical protein GYH30_022978 [Glycine max]|uniref:Uncharacterized protein n=1 Tax=Glycine max TaxID=3847 RepID=A0A0R0IV08_SOYBN|nr:hypothetical protein GYH30_022978 [Glycine max]
MILIRKQQCLGKFKSILNSVVKNCFTANCTSATKLVAASYSTIQLHPPPRKNKIQGSITIELTRNIKIKINFFPF